MVPNLALLATQPWRWLYRLGGPGLLLLGLIDNSPVPLPGSMDLLTIWLAARDPGLWPVYAVVATLGSLVGGYLTYALARKTGHTALERRLSRKTTGRVYRFFQRWGFLAVVLPALLPPPVPIVPFLVAAGALQYPPRKFITALTLGRAVRFTVIASLGAHYGDEIVKFFSKYYEPTLWILVALTVAGALLSLYSYLKHGRKAHHPARSTARQKTA